MAEQGFEYRVKRDEALNMLNQITQEFQLCDEMREKNLSMRTAINVFISKMSHEKEIVDLLKELLMNNGLMNETGFWIA